MPRQAELPYFKLYPGDWMKHPGLRSVSLAARGLWIDMLCRMHESDRRGYLQLNGNLVNAEQLARMTGCSTDECSRLLQELIDSGVCSCTPTGMYFSATMVSDERKRKLCSEAGRKGGNPTLKGRVKGGAKGGANPSYSGSCSGAEREPPNPPDGGGGFDRFWSAWPKHDRKVDRRKCAEKWRRNGWDGIADVIVAGLERWKRSRQWRQDNGKYIPMPMTWLNGQRWEAMPEGATTDDGSGCGPIDPERADELLDEIFGRSGGKHTGPVENS